MGVIIKNRSVCFVVDYSILIGGKERQLLETLRYLKSINYDFRIISLSSQGLLCEKLSQDYQEQTLLVNRLERGFFGTAQALRRLIRGNKWTLFHCFDNLSVLYLLIASVFLHLKIINGSIRHAGVNKSFNYIFDYILLQLSSKVIANSREGLRYYHIRGGMVLYNAVDAKRFTRASKNRNCVIMTANFSDYKDHNSFFTATIPLVKSGMIKKVGLLGDGPYMEYWQKYISGTGLGGFYSFYGHKPDVENILSEYGTGVLCSTKKYREGISNSILEYMGSGLFVIASDVGATKEIIHDKENGLLFRAEESSDLQARLEWVLSHPLECENMIEKAYLTLNEKFNYEANMQKLVSAYNSIA